MIIGVFGSNGHGKGQLLIKLFLDYQKENDAREKKGETRRKIYTNVHGINSSRVKPLIDCHPIPSGDIWYGKQDDADDLPPEGYFVPEVGSIFCYDECQDIEIFKQKSGALSSHPSVISLAKHRHSGLDVIFCTQQMNYVHSHIQGLFAPLYVVERPLNVKMTNVFKFNKAKQSGSTYRIPPNSQSDDQFPIILGKKLGQYYISSAEHNMKSTIPLKVKLLLAAFACCLLLLLYKALQNNKAVEAKKEEKTKVQEQYKKTKNVRSELIDDEKIYDERQEQREKYLPSTVVDFAYDEEIRIAAVIKMGKICMATNSYGERLNITDKKCNFLINNPSHMPRSRNRNDNSFLSDDNNSDNLVNSASFLN